MLGTSEGGTGRHVAMLARGSEGAGLQVRVFGPASTRTFFGDAGFETVAISDRPHPVGDAAAMRGFAGCCWR